MIAWLFVLFFLLIVIVTIIIVVCCEECDPARKKRRREAQALAKPKAIYAPRVGNSGRFGNQCFQVAAAFSLAMQHSRPLRVFWPQGSELFEPSPLVMFDHKVSVPMDAYTEHETEEFMFENIRVPEHVDVAVTGYRQHPDYFQASTTDLRSVFQIKSTIKAKVLSELPFLEDEKISCIGMHVRRGDFIGNSKHNVCTVHYYKSAISYLYQTLNVPNILIVSDDKAWCKQHLQDLLGEESCYDKNVVVAPFETQEEDFTCLSMCKALVIPNSTFSFWAAWIANAAHVVAPSPWLREFPTNNWKNLYLSGWHVLDVDTHNIRSV